MVSVGSRDVSCARGDTRERQASADKRSANRFRCMFDQAVALAGPAPVSMQTWTAPGDDDDASRAAVQTRARVADAPPPAAACVLSTDTQTLTLRASTGPLAGLIVQAHWRGNRLQVSVSASTDALKQRLAQHRDALIKTLGETLGIPITLEIGSANV